MMKMGIEQFLSSSNKTVIYFAIKIWIMFSMTGFREINVKEMNKTINSMLSQLELQNCL